MEMVAFAKISSGVSATLVESTVNFLKCPVWYFGHGYFSVELAIAATKLIVGLLQGE